MAGVNTSVSVTDNMSAVFQAMTASINTCLGTFIDMQSATSEGLSLAQVENMTACMADLNVAAHQFEESLSEAGDEQEQLNQHMASGVSNADSLLGKVIGIASAYASWQAVGKVIEISDGMTQTTARVDAMNDGLQTTEEVMKMIYQAAEDARGSYTEMANVVAKLGNNAKEAFSGTEEIINFAELVQKQFTIAGASTTEASNAMLQLTQGLGSGALRGDELNSIFEQAPNIIRTIADYLEVPIGKIREMASDGEITADIVKNAMFSAADEINAKFDSMPTTWAQVGQSMQNQAMITFQPILNMISQVTAMQEFQTVVAGMTNGFAVLATVAIPVVEFMINGAAWIVENWSWISPIIGGVVTIMGIYLGVLAAYNIAQAVSNGLRTASAIASVAHGTATAAEAAATVGMTTAQMSLNAALYACPVTWILVIIIAVIAAIFAVIAAINEVTGSSISATGVIVGALSVAVAAVWNIIYGLFSFVVGIGVELYNLIAVFANFFANVFDNPVGAIINLFVGLFDVILGIVQSAAALIDSVLGTDLASGVEGFRNTVADAAAELVGDDQKVVMEKLSQSEVMASIGLERMDYGEAYDWGYNKGESLGNSIESAFSLDNFGIGDIATGIDDLGEYSAVTADNTGAVADSLEVAEDNLAWMKDIAEREIIDRTVFRDIKVDMGGVNNIVNNNQDLDSIGQYLVDTLEEQMASSAEGV